MEHDLTIAERKYMDFIHGRSGSFYDYLFRAMQAADSVHLTKLAEGFPEEVAVVHRWRSEEQYASLLEQRYTHGR